MIMVFVGENINTINTKIVQKAPKEAAVEET
jgi:hypothetical protein